jgi:hypothetical protein
VGTSLLLTLLYFIDEGCDSLEGLLIAGKALVMSIYLVGILLGMITMARLFATRCPGVGRTVSVIGSGSLLGLRIGLLLIVGLGAA